MRQYPERRLTQSQEKIAGRHWPTRQIVCLVDRKDLYYVLKRLSALGQIDEVRALCISDDRRAMMTDADIRNIWDLFVAVTYRELGSSTSCIAAYEYAESWMYTTINNKKYNVAKIKHHDVDSPGIGVKPAVILPDADQEGYSCVPERTRSLLFTNQATAEPIDVTDDLVASSLKRIWREVTHNTRRDFVDEIAGQSEWAVAVNADWSKIFDIGVWFEREQLGVTTWESVEIAMRVHDRCRSLKLGDGRVIMAQWAADPVLKDFLIQNTVRQVLDGEEDDIAQERLIGMDAPVAEDEEESEEE
ncbi:hypothetical protein L211DRAFT_845069 [Terfezia boudieri ATCC MYA-4762]|uniref:Uncharacterized protein n=1 Tax=Terfezia boudieri ATCC MYA-4762 TaxID=1051890 RepID=A0A3N4M1W4_9PEZI|nr:hypothetical protein L211DRAFT_845069 [Terfezia boudieri ATCC MYA-4762]